MSSFGKVSPCLGRAMRIHSFELNFEVRYRGEMERMEVTADCDVDIDALLCRRHPDRSAAWDPAAPTTLDGSVGLD